MHYTSNQAFRFFARERIISQQQFNQNNYFGMPSTDLSFTFTVMDYLPTIKTKHTIVHAGIMI